MMFAEFKGRLADQAVAVLGPIGTEMQRLLADEAYIDAVLADGAVRAQTISQPIMDELYDVMGLAR